MKEGRGNFYIYKQSAMFIHIIILILVFFLTVLEGKKIMILC